MISVDMQLNELTFNFTQCTVHMAHCLVCCKTITLALAVYYTDFHVKQSTFTLT